MQLEEEVFFQCPYCWQEISMLFEKELSEQKYVEDCEVCCQPIEVTYAVVEDAVVIQGLRRLDE